MKNVVIVLLLASLVSLPLVGDESKALEKAKTLTRHEKFEEALRVIDEELKAIGFSEKLMRLKYGILRRTERYEEALAVLNLGIKEKGENPDVLGEKAYILGKMKRFNEALPVMLRKEELDKKKKPWVCMDIAYTYANLKQLDKAFEWINEAVKRGYNDYVWLRKDAGKWGISGDKRLGKVINRIKKKIGLGNPAKDFTVNIFDGGSFQLSRQKGSVVLIDFWATWCPPCVKAIPFLKQVYQELHPRGFELIGISLDKKEEDLKKYLDREKLGWGIAFSGKAWDDETRNLYGVMSIPSYWLVDKKGVLRHFGLRKEALKKAIVELLEE